jgi:hypothetical protein
VQNIILSHKLILRTLLQLPYPLSPLILPHLQYGHLQIVSQLQPFQQIFWTWRMGWNMEELVLGGRLWGRFAWVLGGWPWGRFACSWSYRAFTRHCFHSTGSSKDRRSIIDIDIIGVVVTWIPQSASKIEIIKEKKIYLLVWAKNLINCLTHSL